MSENPPLEPATKTRMMSGTELRTLARSGGFAVDENTGDRMIESLEGVINALEQRWDRLQMLGEDPPIGTSAAARFVSGRMVETAGDDRGLLTQLRAAREEFPAYVEAIRLAKRNYAERERTTGEGLQATIPEV